MTTRIERIAIGAVVSFIAVSAAAGAIGLIGGGLPFPPEWLDGTPFSNYVGPGIILGVVVGGSALLASVLVLRGHPLAVPAAFVAGMIQVGWIVGEVLLVGTYGAVMLWLQVILRRGRGAAGRPGVRRQQAHGHGRATGGLAGLLATASVADQRLVHGPSRA
jgi:hypothetical protein